MLNAIQRTVLRKATAAMQINAGAPDFSDQQCDEYIGCSGLTEQQLVELANWLLALPTQAHIDAVLEGNSNNSTENEHIMSNLDNTVSVVVPEQFHAALDALFEPENYPWPGA